MLVHTSIGRSRPIMELPNGWDEANFKLPAEFETSGGVGARNPREVAKFGIKVGDSITIPKECRPLLGTRANGRGPASADNGAYLRGLGVRRPA